MVKLRLIKGGGQGNGEPRLSVSVDGDGNLRLYSDLVMIEKRSRKIADTALETYNNSAQETKNLLMLGLYREADALACGAFYIAHGVKLSKQYTEPTKHNFHKLIQITRTVEMLLGYPKGFFG